MVELQWLTVDKILAEPCSLQLADSGASEMNGGINMVTKQAWSQW